MAEIVLIDGVRYELITPELETWLENAIEKNSEHIFGQDSFYFNIKKKIKSKAGVATIPDGYAIFFNPNPQWAVVEIELSSHPNYEHHLVQLTKFKRSIEDTATRKDLADFIYKIFENDEVLRAKLKQKIQSGEVHKFISDLIFQDPLIIVLIDRKTDKLQEATSDIKTYIHIIEFKTFKRKGINDDINAFVFEPIATESTDKKTKSDKSQKNSTEYSKFWEPIRNSNGIFRGEPVPIRDEAWISKQIRKIGINLVLRRDNCFVDVVFKDTDRLTRREKVMKLFPKNKYKYNTEEAPQSVMLKFPVLNKGKRDTEYWPEIRERLVTLGTEIYNKITNSDL